MEFSSLIKYLIVIVLVDEGSSANFSFTIDEESNNLCTEMTYLVWKFSWRYLKDSFAVTIQSVDYDSKDTSGEVMKCSMWDNQLSVRYHGHTWIHAHKQKHVSTKHSTEVFKHYSVTGFVYIAASTKSFKTFIRTIDPTVRAVLLLTNSSMEDISALVKKAWSKYNILNLIIFHSTTINNTVNKPIHLYVSIYNPFIPKDGTRGEIYTFKMKDDDALVQKLLLILDNRLINVYGYPLRICIYEFQGSVAPHMYESGNVTKYKLPDGEIIHAISKTVNFTPQYYSPREGQDFGRKEANGSLTGCLKDVDEGYVDILANTQMFNDYGQNNTQFLFPVAEVEFAFITPKMQIRVTVSFLEIFSPAVSILLTAAFFVMVSSWWCFDKLHHEWRKNNGKKMSFAEICCETFGNFLLISQPRRVLDYERCLFTGWIFFSTIICYTYQGTMVERLTSSFLSADINTLEDLAESDLIILIPKNYKDIMTIIAENEEPPGAFSQLLERTEFFEDTTEAIRRVVENRDAAMLSTLLECMIYQMDLYSSEAGRDSVHVMEGGPPNRYSAHLAPFNSPYKMRFREILLKIKKSGLMPKWSEDVYDDLQMKSSMRSLIYSEPTDSVYKMQELSFIFWSLFGCDCFCCIVLLLELLLDFILKKKASNKKGMK